MNEKPLKAYVVQDDYEGHCCVVFATNSATARRNGAGELNTDWEGIEFCRRAPQWDHYAGRGVPAMEKLHAGWWFECAHCGRRVDLDVEDEDGQLPDACVDARDHVYCSPACRGMRHAQRRREAAAEAALVELVTTKFPGVIPLHVYVYDGHLAGDGRRDSTRANCAFRVPGLDGVVRFRFGDDYVSVPPHMADAFRERYGRASVAA